MSIILELMDVLPAIESLDQEDAVVSALQSLTTRVDSFSDEQMCNAIDAARVLGRMAPTLEGLLLHEFNRRTLKKMRRG